MGLQPHRESAKLARNTLRYDAPIRLGSYPAKRMEAVN